MDTTGASVCSPTFLSQRIFSQSINLYRRTSSLSFKIRRNRSIASEYSCIEVKGLGYRPPGTEINLLNDVNFSLREKSFGLIFGQSGSGKTTLLQLLAGLNKPTCGSICIQRYGNDGKPNKPSQPLPPEKVGIVFQFPERYFIADNILDEVTFGWPRQKANTQLRENLTSGLQRAFNWVGLSGISLDKDPQALSGGYKRRLALAIQLVEVPDLLILDEPLAGLDWKARADVVKLLKHLKKELTIVVVSHDLKELAGLVDQSWRMEMGGLLKEEALKVSHTVALVMLFSDVVRTLERSEVGYIDSLLVKHYRKSQGLSEQQLVSRSFEQQINMENK